MQTIQKIPLLGRKQSYELAYAMRREQVIFERALFSIPGTSMLLLERWEERRREGRVTAALSRHYRDGSGRNWNAPVDAAFQAIQDLVSRDPVATEELPALLDKAELSFEVLCDVFRELQRHVKPSAVHRVRFGLARAAGKRALTRADRAYTRNQEHVKTFARHNLRLVAKCAQGFRGTGVATMDLIQEGNLGLLRAIEKFDPDRGFAFSTYAVWWIQQTMIRAIQNQRRTVRVPSHVCELQLRYRGAVEDLTRRLGREPSSEELAERLKLPREQVEAVEATLAPIRSLHAPVQGFDAVALEDVLQDEHGEDPIEEISRDRLRGAVASLLSTLDSRERKVLGWRFGFGEEGTTVTLSEVGRRLGVSRERARQIEYSALCRLRHRVGVDRLRECLDMAVR